MALNMAIKHFLSEEEYLQGELLAEIKHELIDGELCAIAGVSRNQEVAKYWQQADIYATQ